ncbi:hypothetical protein EGW08_014178 [Elysia chlorotica]|uniref:Uncharacterized protein n=1 Tax=Elysia chlorotica TaxID=188477 RepID=A0A3S0ZM09_ELYCH|nr:hypothetical protein EGW08_014178 [Elysia chlorotica]
MPVMLLRSIKPPELMNGTRCIIRSGNRNTVEVEIAVVVHIGFLEFAFPTTFTRESESEGIKNVSFLKVETVSSAMHGAIASAVNMDAFAFTPQHLSAEDDWQAAPTQEVSSLWERGCDVEISARSLDEVPLASGSEVSRVSEVEVDYVKVPEVPQASDVKVDCVEVPEVSLASDVKVDCVEVPEVPWHLMLKLIVWKSLRFPWHLMLKLIVWKSLRFPWHLMLKLIVWKSLRFPWHLMLIVHVYLVLMFPL